MEQLLYVILFVLLLLSFYQDWKFRGIHWLVFPALTITTVLLFWNTDFSWRTIGMNMLFLAIVFTALTGYVSLKRGELTNIFKSDFGWGDVLFLVAMTPLFSPKNFILFFISGMLISGLFHFTIGKRGGDERIPLAGYLAVYVAVICVATWVFAMDFRYTDWI